MDRDGLAVPENSAYKHLHHFQKEIKNPNIAFEYPLLYKLFISFFIFFLFLGCVCVSLCMSVMFNTYSLSASLNSSSSPTETREKLYLLAVGHYRSSDYSRSRQLVERCLEVLSCLVLKYCI